ncbi:MAG: hypothetical protein HRU20_19740 [Pseudomonadales bacterium]|nr:hypothetical protein [Pseudomonadales bacterium]
MASIFAPHAYAPRDNSKGGNFCWHNPAAPSLGLMKPVNEGTENGKGGVPWVIRELIDRLPEYFWNPEGKLHSLNNANDSDRQQRTERRESCICVLMAILKHTDLVTMRMGIPNNQGFKHLSWKVIANATGYHIKRVQRAVKDLKAAGIITVKARYEIKEDGSYRGLSAAKSVSPLIFAAFGLDKRLAKARKKLAKSRKEKTLVNMVTPTARARDALRFKGVMGEKSRKKPQYAANDGAQSQRILSDRLIKYVQDNPNASLEDLKAFKANLA